MFSAYYLFVTAGMELQHLGQLKNSIIIAGLTVHYILIAALLIYGAMLAKNADFFGEFWTKFSKDIWPVKYYCWLLCERITTSIGLTMIKFRYQSFVILAIIIVQLIFISVKQPYASYY
jgi:hypothetical protein